MLNAYSRKEFVIVIYFYEHMYLLLNKREYARELGDFRNSLCNFHYKEAVFISMFTLKSFVL